MGTTLESLINQQIRQIPDFPKPGINFYDVTPLMSQPEIFGGIIAEFAKLAKPLRPQVIVGIEARGFIFGAPLARELGIGFVPVRKPGKLPYKVERIEYTLEYGSGQLEMHNDAVKRGTRALVVDDLIATGGTARATCELLQRMGADIAGFLCVVELTFLGAVKILSPVDIISLVNYDS